MKLLITKSKYQVAQQDIVIQDTGHYAIWSIKTSAIELKQKCVALESGNTIARLWDIDVLDETGKIISRTELGDQPRRCLICEAEAKICARSRTHDIETLQKKIYQIASLDKFANTISNIAYQSLIEEVQLTPKPGLVDAENNGAHDDMNMETFIESAVAIKPFFKDFILTGCHCDQENIHLMLANLRIIGLEAEQAMFIATNNINTHKGAIFSLALFCGALGFLWNQNIAITDQTLQNTIKEIAQNLTNEMKHVNSHLVTAGIKLYQRYQVKGVRGEAESGYETIWKYGLLHQKSDLHFDDTTHEYLFTLINFISFNIDTNVLNRGGKEGLYWIQSAAQNIVNNHMIASNKIKLAEAIRILNQECIEKWISPGGSADLLILNIFLTKIFNHK